jgi:hypothetical protein
VAAEFDRAPLGTRQQFATNAAPAQFGMTQRSATNSQPAQVEPTSPGMISPRPLRTKKQTREKPVSPRNSRLYASERVADRIAMLLRSPILEAQSESRGQVHRTPPVANANSHSSRRKVSCARENIWPW